MFIFLTEDFCKHPTVSLHLSPILEALQRFKYRVQTVFFRWTFKFVPGHFALFITVPPCFLGRLCELKALFCGHQLGHSDNCILTPDPRPKKNLWIASPKLLAFLSKKSHSPKDNSSVIAYLNGRPGPSPQSLDLSLFTLLRCCMV